jgi:acetolactate synthase-1/2/3 large subunit
LLPLSSHNAPPADKTSHQFRYHQIQERLMTATEWLVQGLQERGVEWMATLCGHGLDPLYHAARNAGMLLVDTRNEQTAAYMAECYGRLTGRPGICAVSSGVAHVNALTGFANAWFDGAPMLLISGAAAFATAGLGHFQDMDQVSLARPMAKYAHSIDCAERTIQILDEALQAATSPPPGPVHLTFPMDIQNTEVERMVRPSVVPKYSVPAGDEVDLDRFESPLIVAGSGVFYAGEGEELMCFSERFSIPMVVPIWDRGCVTRKIDTFMGVIGAASGGPKLLTDADCLILAGATVDYRLGYLHSGPLRPEATVVQGWRQLRGTKRHDAWLADAGRRREDFRHGIVQVAEEQAKKGMHALHIISALRPYVDQDAVLLIDGGSIGQWAHQLLGDRYPGHWLTCGRSGVVGWGLGGAMAARLAYPKRPVILLAGDGAFTFNVAEIECAVRQDLHFVAIVADDLGWGITRTGHLKQFGEVISSDLGPVDFVRLAESLGARGVSITSPDQLTTEIDRALGERAVTVLHVRIVGGNPA